MSGIKASAILFLLIAAVTANPIDNLFPTDVTTTDLDEGSALTPTEEVPATCIEPYSFTITYTAYEFTPDGEIIAVNRTRTIHTNRCCDGYVGDDCELDLCRGLVCSEDNSSICIVAKRCGQRFPIFVTGIVSQPDVLGNEYLRGQGILADQCTQPEAAIAHLCPNDTCAAGSSCTLVDDLGIPNDPLLCLGNGCGCTPGPVWYKVRNGLEAECV